MKQVNSKIIERGTERKKETRRNPVNKISLKDHINGSPGRVFIKGYPEKK